jgi:hypothetical protein
MKAASERRVAGKEDQGSGQFFNQNLCSYNRRNENILEIPAKNRVSQTGRLRSDAPPPMHLLPYSSQRAAGQPPQAREGLLATD